MDNIKSVFSYIKNRFFSHIICPDYASIPIFLPGPPCVSVLRGKVACQCGSKEYHKVRLHNKLHTRFIKREEPRRVDVSAQARSSRELGRRRGLYRISWDGGRAFQGEDWWNFKPRAWAFYSEGRSLSQGS